MKRILDVLPYVPESLSERLLEELIYQRLRLALDVCDLMTFRDELSTSVVRALARQRKPAEDRGELTMRYLNRAWDRLGEELLSELAQVSFLEGERGPPATFRRPSED